MLFVQHKMSISKLIVFALLLSTLNQKFIVSVMSQNQNLDHCNVKIRFRFFRFLSVCKIIFLHFIRLLLCGDINLMPSPFPHIHELDILIDIVSKDSKSLDIYLFNSRILKSELNFFH